MGDRNDSSPSLGVLGEVPEYDVAGLQDRKLIPARERQVVRVLGCGGRRQVTLQGARHLHDQSACRQTLSRFLEGMCVYLRGF